MGAGHSDRTSDKIPTIERAKVRHAGKRVGEIPPSKTEGGHPEKRNRKDAPLRSEVGSPERSLLGLRRGDLGEEFLQSGAILCGSD